MGFKTDYVEVKIPRYKKGKDFWAKLLSSQKYTSSAGDVYVVPEGFETDFASVPRLLRWLYAPFGKYTQASILHDYFYSGKGVKTRKEADKLFYEAGCSSFMRKIGMYPMYFAVRYFAWYAYTSPSGKKGALDGAGVAGIFMALGVLGLLGLGIYYKFFNPSWSWLFKIIGF